MENEKYVGLYGESLILKGLHLYDDLFEAEQKWNFRIKNLKILL